MDNAKIRVGLIGIGAIGRTHFGCYKNTPDAELVALCDIESRKLEGDWSRQGFNLGTQDAKREDLSALRTYTDWREIIADPNIDVIDVCLPIDIHAEVAVAALKAGKHVLCEKPMARTSAECREMEAAASESGKQLMIAHCLRYWPHYVETQKIIAGGEYGKPLYARFHRASGTPKWSYHDWLRTAERSGGSLLDMHVHDVDAALWFFGKPDGIEANGIFAGDLPTAVDAVWSYGDGLRVYLHNGWDENETPFRYSFSVSMEKGTIAFDSSSKEPKLRIYTIGSEPKIVELDSSSAYQNEIDDFTTCLRAGGAASRITLPDSRAAVEAVEEETRQLYAKQGRA